MVAAVNKTYFISSETMKLDTAIRMKNFAEDDNFKMYNAAVKGIEIIRTGLRNIATTSEKNKLPSQGHAPVMAKYDIAGQSSTSYQFEPTVNVSVLGMGHGFGKRLIQNPSWEFLSQLKGILVQCMGEQNSNSMPSVRCSGCASIVKENGTMDKSKSTMFDTTINKPAKCVFTKKILPVPACGEQNLFATVDTKSRLFSKGGKVRKKSLNAEHVMDNEFYFSSSVRRAHSSKTASMVSSTTKSNILENKITSKLDSLMSKCDVPLEPVVDFVDRDQNNAAGNLADTSSVTNDPNCVPQTVTPSSPSPKCTILRAFDERTAPVQHNGYKFDSTQVPTSELDSVSKSEENEANKSSNTDFSESSVSPKLDREAVVCQVPSEKKSENESWPVLSTSTLKDQDGKCTSQPVVMFTDHTEAQMTDIKVENNKIHLGDANKQKNFFSEKLMSIPMQRGCKNDTFEFASPDQSTTLFESSVSNKKRPRPRRSSLNSDKKMWMSKKSAADQVEQTRGHQGSSGQQEDIPSQPASPDDVLVRAFGYDPSDDAFSNTRTDVCVPLSLNGIQVPVFSRQQIMFHKNMEDECVIAHQGTSSALYLASKVGKDLVVKDSSQSYLSAETVLREARILSVLNGTSVTPHLHGILEQGVLSKEYCTVQDNCDGFLSLTQLLQSGYYISRSDWMRISVSLVSHLKVLHSHRVLHNNICPDNILVNKDSLEVKLVGFGQASYRQGVKMSRTVRQGHYLSPEVKYGCISSPQSDVYALGSVLEQVMTESRVMALHEVVLLSHKDLPRDRPQADQVFSMVKDICDKLCS